MSQRIVVFFLRGDLTCGWSLIILTNDNYYWTGAVSDHSEIRNTTQRQVILEELQKLSNHPTAAELYQVVRKRLPHISLGTVYRNLEVLSRAGRIHILQLAGSEKRFDGRVDNHYHLRCVRCGRVEDLPLPPLQAIDEAVQKLSEYEILSYRIEFVGTCAQCKQAEQRRE